jgi:hypothetical protein
MEARPPYWASVPTWALTVRDKKRDRGADLCRQLTGRDHHPPSCGPGGILRRRAARPTHPSHRTQASRRPGDRPQPPGQRSHSPSRNTKLGMRPRLGHARADRQTDRRAQPRRRPPRRRRTRRRGTANPRCCPSLRPHTSPAHLPTSGQSRKAGPADRLHRRSTVLPRLGAPAPRNRQTPQRPVGTNRPALPTVGAARTVRAQRHVHRPRRQMAHPGRSVIRGDEFEDALRLMH